MADMSKEDERHSADEAAKPVKPFLAPKRAKTFESGGPMTNNPEKLRNLVHLAVQQKKQLAKKSANTYVYQDFNYHEDIRVMRLLRGKKEDPLECLLFPSALPPTNNKPSKSTTKFHQYHALSYCWGDPAEDANKELFIHTDTSVHEGQRDMTTSHELSKFHIRSNLYSALKQFRRTNKDINLWVDAVCINQEDETKREKTAQVARMNRVYSQADSVLVWLGEGSSKSDTKETFQFLEDILNLDKLDDLITDKKNRRRWELLLLLLRNQWFSRRWIIQELALAREAVVHWGSEKMMWLDFADAIALAMTKHQEIRELFRKTPQNGRIQPDIDIPQPEALTAHILVNASSNLFRRSEDGHIQQRLMDLEVLVSCLFLPFEALEPRDTVYAVLSLARDTRVHDQFSPRFSWLKEPNNSKHMILRWSSTILQWVLGPNMSTALEFDVPIDDRITPDYGKSLTDVWTDFIEYCIEKSNSLDILCRHWAPPPRRLNMKGQLETTKEESIPSWVPAIHRHAYGPKGILCGRENGDGFVGTTPNQQRYNASGGLPCSAYFGKIQYQVHGPTPELIGTTLPKLDTLPHTIPRKFDGTLHVKGFKIDVVQKFSGRVLDGVIPAEGLQFGGWKKDHLTGEDPQRVPDLLWRTLVADRDLDGMTAPTWYRRACLECLQFTNADGDLNTNLEGLNRTQTMKTFVERMQAITWCRRF